MALVFADNSKGNGLLRTSVSTCAYLPQAVVLRSADRPRDVGTRMVVSGCCRLAKRVALDLLRRRWSNITTVTIAAIAPLGTALSCTLYVVKQLCYPLRLLWVGLFAVLCCQPRRIPLHSGSVSRGDRRRLTGLCLTQVVGSVALGLWL